MVVSAIDLSAAMAHSRGRSASPTGTRVSRAVWIVSGAMPSCITHGVSFEKRGEAASQRSRFGCRQIVVEKRVDKTGLQPVAGRMIDAQNVIQNDELLYARHHGQA